MDDVVDCTKLYCYSNLICDLYNCFSSLDKKKFSNLQCTFNINNRYIIVYYDFSRFFLLFRYSIFDRIVIQYSATGRTLATLNLVHCFINLYICRCLPNFVGQSYRHTHENHQPIKSLFKFSCAHGLGNRC